VKADRPEPVVTIQQKTHNPVGVEQNTLSTTTPLLFDPVRVVHHDTANHGFRLALLVCTRGYSYQDPSGAFSKAGCFGHIAL